MRPEEDKPPQQPFHALAILLARFQLNILQEATAPTFVLLKAHKVLLMN